jgi:transketolase
MNGLPMREQFVATASDLLEENPSVAVVLADISAAMFTDATRRHPRRVVNVGIREQLLVNVGAGMALTGMRPIIHTFATFLIERAFEQVKLGFAHQGATGVLVSAGASYDLSRCGRTHQAPGDVALLDTLPGWTVQVPGHPAEVDTLLRAAVTSDRPVYLRTSTQQNTEPRPVDRRGQMTLVRQGSRGTVVAVGPMLDPVLAATEGINVTVLYASTVRPFDSQALVSTLHAPNVVLVEPYLAGTSAHCVANALAHLPHRLLTLGVPRVELRRYGTPDEHASQYGLEPGGIRQNLEDFLNQRGHPVRRR